MIQQIKDIYEWAEFELMNVQFCDNWADDAARERRATQEIMYAMCLRFEQMLLETIERMSNATSQGNYIQN